MTPRSRCISSRCDIESNSIEFFSPRFSENLTDPIFLLDETFSTSISSYCRDVTFSTLISIYCRTGTLSTLISIQCRDEKSFQCCKGKISNLISIDCLFHHHWWKRKFYLDINLVPWWNILCLAINSLPWFNISYLDINFFCLDEIISTSISIHNRELIFLPR